MTDSRDRTLEIHEITFDARDPHALAVFWSAMLDREVRSGDMPADDSVLVMPAPGQPGLLFLRVPDVKCTEVTTTGRAIKTLISGMASCLTLQALDS